jgi:WD40 repeat protein
MSDIVSNAGYFGQSVAFVTKEAYCFISGNSLCIYELKKGPREMIWREQGIGCICTHVGSESLALAPSVAAGPIEIVHFSNEEVTHTFIPPATSEIISMEFSRDGNKLYALSGLSDPKVMCWSIPDDALVFCEPVKGNYTKIHVSPGNDSALIFSGDEGCCVATVTEITGSHHVRMEAVSLSDDEAEDEALLADAAASDAITFVMWLPFDYVILGNRKGLLVEARFDGSTLQVLRTNALRDVAGASFKTFATTAVIGLGSLIIGCNTGMVYWFSMANFSLEPSANKVLMDTASVLQKSQSGAHVSTLVGDAAFTSIIIGTRAGGLMAVPSDIQERVIDADADIDLSETEATMMEPIEVTPTSVSTFQQGAVLCSKAIAVPYDNKNSIQCFITASHLGTFHMWRQPFVEAENIADNSGVRRSVPRQCMHLLSAQAGFDGQQTVICSLEVLPFRAKGGTCMIAVGTDKGWLEIWEISASLEDEDEGEGGDDAVRVNARKVSCRRFYENSLDSLSASLYPSSVSVTNVLAVASAYSNVVHVIEVNNTANGLGFDVRCTHKLSDGNVASSFFDGSNIFVSSTGGTIYKWNTASFSSGPLTFSASSGKLNLGSAEVTSTVYVKPAGSSDAEPTFVGLTDNATSLCSVEMATPDEPRTGCCPHTSIVLCMAPAPNGRYIATGCVDGSTYLWEKQALNGWNLVNKLHLHSDSVSSLCFSTDSSLMLSCSLDGSVFLSTVCEGKLYKQDARAMKINDRASVDVEFTNLTPDHNASTWMTEKEAKEFELLKIANQADIDAIKDSLAKLSDKHAKLVEENDARTELEQMDHSEFVVDITTRDKLHTENRAAVDNMHQSYDRQRAWNELTAARVRGDYWDSMDLQSRPLLPILSDDKNLTQYSFSVRKYAAAEQDRLDKVRRMRCLEIRAQQVDGGITNKLPGGKTRVGWKTALQGSPEAVAWLALDGVRWPCEDVIQYIKDKEAQEEAEAAAAKKGPKGDDDDDEEDEEDLVADEEEEHDENNDYFDETDIFNLLYAPQACQTQVQKRTQIILLKEVSRLVCAKFNTYFDKLVAEKEDVIASVEAKNQRIAIILGELQEEEEQFQPKWQIVEHKNSAVKIFDFELENEVYESEKDRIKRLAEEEEARRREAEKDADNIQGRALEDMMNGVLSVKKDMLSDDALIRPAWMDELDPKDMSELQLKELDEFDEKCRLIAEEQVKYKKALEVELKGLKQSNIETIKDFDAKLQAMSETKVIVQKELLTQELYVARIALSMARRDAAWTALKKNEEAMNIARDSRQVLRAKMDAFGVTVEGVRAELNAAQEEERTMDKAFNRNLQDATGATFDQESLKVFKNLFRKRTFPSGGDDEEEGGDLDAEESLDDKNSKGSKSASAKGSKSASKKAGSAAPGGSKAPKGSAKASGSKGGKENVGPMQEAAKALGADDTSATQMNEDMNDPFYFSLLQKDKAAKSFEKEVPLLEPLSIESDCPENFSVDQFTWSKLQELRMTRIEKEIEVKKLQVQLNALSVKMDALSSKEEQLASAITDHREFRSSTEEEIRFLDSNLEGVVCLKKGNDEIDKDAVVSEYADGIMLPCSVIEKFNSRIREHGKEKISVLTRIKQFRRKINIIDWNAKHLSMQSHHYEEYFTDLQLLRVTRDLQQVIRDGSDESQTKQRLEKIAQRKDFLAKNNEVKIQKLRKFNEGMRKNLKDKESEVDTLHESISTLKTDLAQRQSVQQSRNDARGSSGDAGATATLKMKKVVQRRQLVDTARAQAEEIDYLRQELDKMRQRTFPSFAKLKKGH